MGDLVQVEIVVDEVTALALADPQRRRLAGRLVERLARAPDSQDRLAGWLDGLERLEKLWTKRIEGLSPDDLLVLEDLLQTAPHRGTKVRDVVTVGDIAAAAVGLLGSEQLAQFWLFSFVPALGHRRPVDLLEEQGGGGDVLRVLGRLLYGVVS